MLRSFAIALGTVVALAAVHPADAAGSRHEARSSGKASRAVAARPAVARSAVTAARRPAAVGAGASRRMAAIAPRGRTAPARGHRAAEAHSSRQVFAVRGASRREALRYADRRPTALHGNRSGLRFVSLFSAAPAAAATLPARGGKYSKASYTSRVETGDEGYSSGRMGVWHAGLPAADGEQMDCPAGTMAVLARGHSDTFRCMPM